MLGLLGSYRMKSAAICNGGRARPYWNVSYSRFLWDHAQAFLVPFDGVSYEEKAVLMSQGYWKETDQALSESMA